MEIKSHYEVGFKNVDPDTGDVKYTPIALTMTEENAMVLVYSLQKADEDPNTPYVYNKIGEQKI